MLSKENIQHVSDEFRDTRKTAHTNVVTRKYVIMIRNKHIYDFWKTVSYFALSFTAITYGDVNYDYMQETFTTWEEQRNNFALGKEKEKYVSEKSKTLLVLCYKISDTFRL